MLDKLNADRYTDADYVIFLDTDTVLWRDLTKDQVMDSEGRTKMCWRNAADAQKEWNTWMAGHVYHMFGWGPQDNACSGLEFMCCLGFAYPAFVFPQIRKSMEAYGGLTWKLWQEQAFSPTGAGNKGPIPCTDFNAMGYIMCRDFHDKVEWIRSSNYSGMATIVNAVQAWSWDTNDAEVASAKQQFNCLIEHQHEAQSASPYTQCPGFTPRYTPEHPTDRWNGIQG